MTVLIQIKASCAGRDITAHPLAGAAMPILKSAGVVLFAAAGAALLAGAFGTARDRAKAQAVWSVLERAGGPGGAVYVPAMTDGLHDVARRYFANAIAPGTPLATGVRFSMEGVFALNGRDLPVRAEHVLVPPLGFVWRAEDGIDRKGNVTHVVTHRWTDADPEGVWRHQPFGGRMIAHDRHGGCSVPVAMEVGNLFGAPEYAPFFRARLTNLRFRD